MPIHMKGIAEMPPPDGRAWLDRMPGSDIPVIRQPFAHGDALPFWAGSGRAGQHHLYDLGVDPEEQHNLVGTAHEREAIELLRHALVALRAPDEQLVRLGIA